MRIILTALAVFLTTSGAYAQVREWGGAHLSLRTSPTAPLESDANVMLGVGLQWKSRWAVIADGGYIFADPYENNSSIENERDRVSGLKLRSELRYYLKDISYSKKSTFYLATVFHYKKVVSERWEEFGINCVNGNCDYFQIDTYKLIKQELGGMLTVGSFSPLFGGDRVGLDAFIGLGIKVKKYWNTDLPPASTLLNQPANRMFSTDRDGEYPMVPMGVKISFRLF